MIKINKISILLIILLFQICIKCNKIIVDDKEIEVPKDELEELK
jgi:hypothetical protein